MADQKLTALSAATVASAGDVFYIVTDTGSSPTSKKIAFANLKSSLPVYAGTGNKYIMADTASDTISAFRLIQSGNSITVSTAGNNIIINAVTNSSLVYAATGNKYVVMDLAADLTGEFRLAQSGNSISVTTAAGLVTINATTGDLSVKQDSISFPLIVGSGGTGLTTSGNYASVLGVSNGLSYFAIQASDNVTVTNVGTGIFISATTNAGGSTNTAGLVQSSRTISTIYPLSGGGNLSTDRTHAIDTAFLINSGRTISTTYPLSGGGNFSSDRTFFIQTGAIGQVLITSGGVTGDLIWVNTLGGTSSLVYAATGNKYIVTDLAADLTAELRLVQSGNSITISTAGNLVTINAVTSDITGKQDSISFPLSTGSGGTGRSTIGSAHTLLGVNSSEASLTYYALLASDNTTIIKSGTAILISATTNAGSSTNTASLVQSSRTISTVYPLSGGGDLSTDRTHAIDTAFLVNSGRTISTTYPLSGGGNLSANRTFFIQTGAIGQVLITSGGVTGDLAWVNTLGGAAGAVYAATGNTYIVTDFATDLTGEFRLVQSGNSITISTASNIITINAITGNLSTKQDSVTFPLGTNSGGTGLSSVGSAHTLLGVLSDGSTLVYYALLASDNATVIKSGTGIFISAITNAGGSTSTAGLVQSSRTISTVYPISGGGDLSVDRTHAVDTAFLINSGRTISTTYPLSGGGNLSANRTFFIQTGAVGQVLITSGGVTGDLAWVNTLGGAAGAVYAATGNTYIVMSTAADLTGEFRLIQSGNSITIDTSNNLIIVNALTAGPAGSDTQVQFNDGGVFGASSNLTYSKSINRLGILGSIFFNHASNAVIAVSSQITANTNGSNLIIRGAAGLGTGTAGSITIQALAGGNSGGGGNISITGGDGGSAAGKGGNINIAAGFGQGAGVGGEIFLTAGDAGGGDRNGGDVEITLGMRSGTGSDGRLKVFNASSNVSVEFNFDNVSDVRILNFPDSSGTIANNSRYPILLASGGNLSIGTGSVGQVLITSGGVSGDLAWVNTLGGAAGAVYAATGNTYVVTDFAADLTGEFRLVQSGNSITVNTASNLIVINALTGNLSVKQDSITFPLGTNSGGTGRSTIGSAHTLLGVNSSEASLTYYAILASDNTTIVKLGTGIFISATTNAGGSTSTAGLVQSSRTISTVYPISGGGNLSLDRTFAVDTAFLVNTGRTLSAGSGITGGGSLSADRSFSVNTDVRDKVIGFFGPGNLSTAMLLEETRFYIPFNMELRRVNLAATVTAGGAGIIVQLNQYNNVLAAGTGIFASANRPQISAGVSVGSSLTFDIGTLYAGSYLGVQMDQVGSTVAGSNLTITVITRTS